MHFTVMLMATDSTWHKAGTKLFVGCGDKITQIKHGATNVCGSKLKEAFTGFKGMYDTPGTELAGWSSYHAGVSTVGITDKTQKVLPWITENDLCEKYGFDETASNVGTIPADTPDVSQKCLTGFWTKFFTGEAIPFVDDMYVRDMDESSVELHTASNLNEHPERSNINTEEFSEASVKVAYPSK